jgi:hypothetical protein
MTPGLRTSSGRHVGSSDDFCAATIGTAGRAEGSSRLRPTRRSAKRRAKRSPMVGCAPCGELELELPAGPFSRSRGRERGEDLCENIGLPKENVRSVGESGEKRERSRGGSESASGGSTVTDSGSLNLEETTVS